MAKKTKTPTMVLTRSVTTNACLHAERCEHAEGIAAAEEIETQLVSPADVAVLRAGGVFVDEAGCLDLEE